MARSLTADRRLAGLRILAQGLTPPQGTSSSAVAPHAVASSLGALQGQDLSGVLASLALRSHAGIVAVTDAFDSGALVRGYPMRGTVFVAPARDLRWMTELCAAAPVRAAVRRRPRLGLEDAHVRTAREVFETLVGPASAAGSGRGVPRAEVFDAWERAGIDPAGGRGYHLLVHLISTGTAAYGPWREGETAVVHADSWLPPHCGLADRFDGDRTAATAELLRRYLLSHGPASLRDFAWWTKLPLTRIREALPLVEDELESALPAEAGLPGEERLWFRPGLLEEYADSGTQRQAMRELLLPGFDELVLGYGDRLFLMSEEQHTALVPGNNGVFKRGAFRRGRLVGIWSRTGPAGRRRLVLEPLADVSAAQRLRFEKLFAAFPHVRE
ncbi:winged helix DNA-binding domain-containing protein [Brevibacterium sp.]|uniref:winged helix DNA-binding domain-containing protein n=1 Tax=Brevibacterium sp. TaxID=1701 RepID=UPI0025BBC820|nr:winged helix DNA-binding domain-containing protein [Brevibacterium sp.]